MLRLKPDVDPTGIGPEILLALQVADGVYAKFGVDCVVTSLRDSTHKAGSFHYTGRAADLRIKVLPPEKWSALADRLHEALGPRYDVILETHKPGFEHLHVEYDDEPVRRLKGEGA